MSAQKLKARYPLSHEFELRITPYAWAKLIFFRDLSKDEVGGFGITEVDNPLFITDIAILKQTVSWGSTELDDEAVADHFDDQVDLGRRPENFARIWVHTHPAISANPSSTDLNTFDDAFGSCDWSVMFIVDKQNDVHARLRFKTGPKGYISLPVEIDYSKPFQATDHEGWQAEYKAKVSKLTFTRHEFGTDPNKMSTVEKYMFENPPFSTARNGEGMTEALKRKVTPDEMMDLVCMHGEERDQYAASLGVTMEDIASFNEDDYDCCDLCGNMKALSDLVDGGDGYRICPECYNHFGYGFGTDVDFEEETGPVGFTPEEEPNEGLTSVKGGPINTERAIA